MRIVRIRILNKQACDLDLKQEADFTPFFFNEKQFTGYWIDGGREVIHFYVGGIDFTCRNTQKNIELFDEILNTI
jgi:hypothetical protein